MKSVVVIIILFFTAFTASAQEEVSLELYLQTAKAQSPLLRDYRNAVRAKAIDSLLIRAGYKPQVGFVSSSSFAPANSSFGYDQTATNGGQYSTLVGVSKTFVSKENLATQFTAVRLSADSIRTASGVSEQDLVRTITTQYLTAYGDQQQLAALQEINRIISNEALLLKDLTQSNIYRQTDYLTFLVTLKQQELQLRQTRIQYQTDFANLAYLCGIVDTSALSKKLLLPQIEIQLFPDMLSSAFYQRYRLDSARLANNIRLINLAYRPHVGVFADAGYNTTQLSSFYRNFGVSAGFSINLPIYDGGRRKLSIQQVRLQEDTRSGYQGFFVKQYTQQIAGFLQQLRATEGLLQDIDEQINYSKGLIDVNEKLMQTGDAKISDFVIAINNYLSAKTLLTQNRIGRLQIINQINYWNR